MWSVLSVRNAKRWLRTLGWVYGADAKGAYTDGKCREDVLQGRSKFIAAMDQYAARMRITDEIFVPADQIQSLQPLDRVVYKNGEAVTCRDGCERCGGGKEVLVSKVVDPVLAEGVRLLIAMYHDECTFLANDDNMVYWKPRWTHPLKKKSRGRGIMVSSFVCKCHGEIKVAIPINTTDISPSSSSTTSPSSTSSSSAAAPSTTTISSTASASSATSASSTTATATTPATITATVTTTTATSSAASPSSSSSSSVASSSASSSNNGSSSSSVWHSRWRRRPQIVELSDDSSSDSDSSSSSSSDEEDGATPQPPTTRTSADDSPEPMRTEHDATSTGKEPVTEARVLFEYGAQGQGYWKGEDLYRQVVDRLIPIFEAVHGNGPNGLPCQGLFIFDNATGHKIFANDALIARSLPLKDGGKRAPRMRNTTFKLPDGTERVQVMINDKGEPKGMRNILKERGKWPSGAFKGRCELCSSKIADDPGRSFRRDCCATRMLECEPDFAAQKCLISEVAEAAGHLTLFLPKFHPELNRTFIAFISLATSRPFVVFRTRIHWVCVWYVAIERLWSAAKSYAREHCQCNFKALREIVPKALDSVPLVTIRRYFRKSSRFLSIYKELDCSPALADYLAAETSFKSHRRVTKNDLQDLIKNLEKQPKLTDRARVMLGEMKKINVEDT